MSYVDFAELKARVTIEQVAEMLALDIQRRGGQLRGPCPACQAGGDRALVITPARQAFYCFGGRTGGDLIALVAHLRGCKVKEAADIIAAHIGKLSECSPASENAANSAGKGSDRERLRPLDYLQAEHRAVQALGISPETAKAWGAGFAGKGIMRGRLAIPIHDREGALLGYCGRAVSKDQQPTLIFPNGFRPESVIFGAHRVGAGPLFLVRDPLDVLVAFESGVENAVALLSPATPQSLDLLARLMRNSGCEVVEPF